MVYILENVITVEMYCKSK